MLTAVPCYCMLGLHDVSYHGDVVNMVDKIFSFSGYSMCYTCYIKHIVYRSCVRDYHI